MITATIDSKIINTEVEYTPELNQNREAVYIASEILDSNNLLQEHANKLVTEAKKDTHEKNETDDNLDRLTGGAIIAAAYEAKGDKEKFKSAYVNHENDVRTTYTEALLTMLAHISEVNAELNENGEAVVGDIRFWEMFLRNASNSDTEVCKAEILEEFFSAALYNREDLRENFSLLVLSPSRSDTKGNTMMARFLDIHQDKRSDKWIRSSQQAYINNSNTEATNQLLRELGVLDYNSPDLDEVSILSTPLLLRKDSFPDGIVDIVQMIDTLTGPSIFFGTEIGQDPNRDMYLKLPEASKDREAAMQEEIDKFAREIYEIVAHKNLSPEKEKEAYSQLLLSSLRRICSKYPEYAEAAFGKEAADKYYEAINHYASGDIDRAEAAYSDAYESSNSVTVCDTVISQDSASSNGVASSSADTKEALHCLELKNQNYTIRHGVTCPVCTKVTGQKVNARESQKTICCLNPNCRHEVEKGSGRIINHSQISNRPEKNIIDQKNITSSNLNSETISINLGSGEYIKIGGKKYQYFERFVVGGVEPVFIRENGEEITGHSAIELKKKIFSPASSSPIA